MPRIARRRQETKSGANTYIHYVEMAVAKAMNEHIQAGLEMSSVCGWVY